MKEETTHRPSSTKPTDERLLSDRFPRSSQYHPEWVMTNGCGANSLWLTEWLSSEMELKPGMRVLDLGCGKGISSIFLAREFGVQVWATDLWTNATGNLQRVRDADVENRVFPIHADARSLPFAGEYFDAIVCVDAFSYFGTDALYLNYLANFVKPDGQMGIAGAGLIQEFAGAVPKHLERFWSQDWWCLHSADWWRRHWERTGIVDVDVSDTMREGWKVWLDWHTTAWPDNQSEIEMLEADRGKNLSYIRMVGRRRSDAKLEEYCWPDTLRSWPAEYEKKPLLRN